MIPKTTTKAPPVTQEIKGVGNLDKDEEGLDDKDVDDAVDCDEDDDGLDNGFTARDEDKDDRVKGEDLAERTA